jgi:hypothetical protein
MPGWPRVENDLRTERVRDSALGIQDRRSQGRPSSGAGLGGTVGPPAAAGSEKPSDNRPIPPKRGPATGRSSPASGRPQPVAGRPESSGTSSRPRGWTRSATPKCGSLLSPRPGSSRAKPPSPEPPAIQVLLRGVDSSASGHAAAALSTASERPLALTCRPPGVGPRACA